ncbi:hypothetical protein [Miltoncostaea oceani]|uniref:Cap15 family cyclic dinucleotide receptor domain-containing protein n=1 Tax=Miltoncostaea oceani TaxID=2843216 RepID=UPI001C3DD560
MTPLTTRTRLVAYCAVGIYSVGLLVYGVTVPSGLARAISFLPAVLAVSFAFFEADLWRRRPFAWIIKRPYLEGTWRGTLTSYRRDAQDTPSSSDHPIVLVVRQSFSTTVVTLLTSESRSQSRISELSEEPNGQWLLQYQYLNHPAMSARDRGSTIHAGSAIAQVAHGRPTRLEGEYWTARDTRGTYDAVLLSRRRVSTFEEGETLMSEIGAH